ncbi:alpha/beta-hydrolase [Aaosphaeria arxii CBS 175.79]|uniref:Alpha/beta-hydrolase n=1 Tax=Aaosphaeria arxii CBS 175.79 TaxID=1450172 RepID=A0A6A5XMS5_9PLEO|nr:alpha/beta-hydrolase [Aaosphaeria arxii CBS 175.79]KAF2014528.1 alpha/beta-hydrolase [Aaosphaeria arxii CBS 175.79]
MYFHSLVLTALCLSVFSSALEQRTDVDLTILTDNDLHGNKTQRLGAAILIGTIGTYEDAVYICEGLHEKLWSPALGGFQAGLNNSLSYEAYLKDKNNSESVYWIQRTTNSTSCSTISTNGTVQESSCSQLLPALCTQSAPMAYPAWADTSPNYRVSQRVGEQTLTGFRDFHTFRFHGVRFAEPPKRFEFSTMYEGYGHADALEYGNDCVQAPMPYLGTMSEDCLFMNIWTPYLPSTLTQKVAKKKLKPVMFWIYGGGNVEGSGTDPEKEGGQLSSRGGVVVVEFSYRLGALGWMSFDDGVHNGNYGVSDMLNALKWTHKYISAFGGDPDRITIFGESAGALGVRTLLTSPLSRDLVFGAIMQSFPAGILDNGRYGGWSNFSEPLRCYERFTKTIVNDSGCGNVTDEVACMREADPYKWVEPGQRQSHLPTRDGVIIPYTGLPVSGPLATPRKTRLAVGTTRDEAAGSIPDNLPLNFTQQMALLGTVLDINLVFLASDPSFNPELGPGWADISNEEKSGRLFNATQRIITDGSFTCLATATAYSAARNNVFESVYQFSFNRTYVAPSEATLEKQELCGRFKPKPDSEEYYKCHAAENPVVLGNVGFLGWPDRDGTDISYSRLIVDYWSSFARTGEMRIDMEYLRARGFHSTEKQLSDAGSWDTVNANPGRGHRIMNLQWSGQAVSEWSEEQANACRKLGFPQDYYESVDYLAK